MILTSYLKTLKTEAKSIKARQDASNVHFDELFVLGNGRFGGDERVREEEELAGSRIHEYRSSEQVNLSAEDDGTLTLRYARPAQNGDTS